jgi:hypothetical protein
MTPRANDVPRVVTESHEAAGGHTLFGALRRSTLSWCRRTRISACNEARDRSNPTVAHQINLQRSPIPSTIDRFADDRQPFRVCGRDSRPWGVFEYESHYCCLLCVCLTGFPSQASLIKSLKSLARPRGFEPLTFAFGGPITWTKPKPDSTRLEGLFGSLGCISALLTTLASYLCMY